MPSQAVIAQLHTIRKVVTYLKGDPALVISFVREIGRPGQLRINFGCGGGVCQMEWEEIHETETTVAFQKNTSPP